MQPMSNYAMTYPQQPGMVGLLPAIPGTQPDLTAYAPMPPASYSFGGQQYSVPYQGQIMGHQGQSYPSPLSPSLIGMNTAQAAAAAVRTSVGPQTEGKLQTQFRKVNQMHFGLSKVFQAFIFLVGVPVLCQFYHIIQWLLKII